jgi:hypothetical protein
MPWIEWFTINEFHPQRKMPAWCGTLFTRVAAHVTFRSCYIAEAFEVRLIPPLDGNAMGQQISRKNNIDYSS